MEGNGARIIFKSHYAKPNRNTSGGTSRYASYIGTREGVVKVTEDKRDESETDSQKKFVQQILEDIPESKKLSTYFDYELRPTLGTASDFISDAMDNYGYKVESIDGYARYMATRPGVTKVSDTGLFSDGDKPVNLAKIQEELKGYKGNVYMPIISLRPEDSIGLGYDNPEAWHKLIEDHKADFAREYKIPLEHMRWVGAYHNAVNAEGYEHNHIHMIIWSTNPNDGWQNQLTGNNLRSVLAKDIFKDELQELYQTKTKTRDEIRTEAKEHLKDLLNDSAEGKSLNSSALVQKEIQELADTLKGIKGRKYYAYLPKEAKQMVDNIMQDIVDSDPRLKELLNTWADSKDKQIKIYSCGEYKLPPVSKIKDFNPIKNQIINQAVAMNKREALLNGTAKTATHGTSSYNATEAQQRAVSRIKSSLLRDIARLSKSDNRKGRMPGKVIAHGAEEIDAQVRRSQGMH